MFCLQEFREPSAEFRGTDFWMLNDALDDEAIRFQLREMKKQGVASFIARTYIGLKSDYPGPQFKQSLKLIVATARELGLKLYLQAGYMPEAVLDLPPDLALRNLTLLPEEGAAEQGEVLVCHEGTAYVAVNTGTFLDMLSKEAIRFYLKQSYEDMWAEFREEFGKTILSVWVDEPSYSGRALPWSREIAPAFRRRWGYDIVPEIPKLYRDIGNYATVRCHYWLTVQALMRDAYFIQVRDWCRANHLLFSGHLMLEDSCEQQLMRAAATMPYYKYFDIPGIDYLTASMEFRHSPLPPRRRAVSPSPGLYTTPLQCTSAAHQAGQTQILAEMYGVSSENLTFRDQKQMFDHFAVLGINHRSVHGIFYSLRGRGKRAYPPHVNYYQPYWKEYGMLTDYCARTSWFISRGTPCREIAVLHPLSSAACEYRGPGAPEGQSEAVRRRDREFLALETDLLHAQCGLELVDEETLVEWGKVESERGEVLLRVGQMRYRCLVLPELLTIGAETLKVVGKFLAAGGLVQVLGEFPRLVDGIPSDEPARVLAAAGRAADRDALVAELVKIPKGYELCCETDASSILVNHRRDERFDYFFLFNSDCREPRRLRLELPEGAAGFLLSAADGSMDRISAERKDGRLSFPLELPEGGSLLFVADREPETHAAPAVRKGGMRTVLPLEGPWSLRRRTPNALVLEFARFRRGEGAYSPCYPILAIQEILSKEEYHGPLVLEYEFQSDLALTGVRLALESPLEQRIVLNGEMVPVRPDGYFLAREFETVPLPPIAVGRNVLELHREFRPLSKARSAITSLFENQRGVELEAVALVGDFAVHSREERTFGGTSLRMNHNFTLGREPEQVYGELVNSGYVFFAGTMELSREFELPAELAERSAWLCFDGFNACVARLFLNGVEQGRTAWYPYSLPLSGLRPGRNVLTVELTNTLRNYLGPWHRPKGEYGECWGGYELPNLCWLGAVDEETGAPIPDWYDHRVPDTSAWTEEYMQVPFGIHSAWLEFR